MHASSNPNRETDGRRKGDPRGAVLVEFALIALLTYLLLAVTIDFGRLFFCAQSVQDAARTAAREISVIPLPPGMKFEEAMQDPQVRARVFQPEHLVIDLENIPGGADLDTFYGTLPVLNQAMRPLMIFDASGGRRLLRYPGALLVDGSTPSGFTVGIPHVTGRDDEGRETIRWVPVVEEIKNPNFPDESPFDMTTPEEMPQRGLVALRLNYPFQGTMLAGYGEGIGGPGSPNLSQRTLADDAGVTEENAAPGAAALASGEGGTYGGPFGLGQYHSAGTTVRPFRKLLSAQVLFRREVFD